MPGQIRENLCWTVSFTRKSDNILATHRRKVSPLSGGTMNQIEYWNTIADSRRLCDKRPQQHDDRRSAFDMDHDRIMYSNFFRRLHDKTQVFPYAPLSSSGQARSRLSHSLEVSCVGRSLGNLLGHHLAGLGLAINPYDIGTIVATACLAHDIGNPPFGHSGEYAIQEWVARNLAGVVEDEWEQRDLNFFEGNAQGFRILTRLETWERAGGLRPTIATLNAFTKYPCSSIAAEREGKDQTLKKHGFFKADRELFAETFSASGQRCFDTNCHRFNRHPLAFLAEAADDICYAVVDLEDAYHLGVIPFGELEQLLNPIATAAGDYEDEKDFDTDIRVARLRSASISALISLVSETITNNLDELADGSLKEALINRSPVAERYKAIQRFSLKRIYNSSRVLEIESAGYRTIGGLLSLFIPAVLSKKPSAQDMVLRRLVPHRFFRRHEISCQSTEVNELLSTLPDYERILSITDYITGMTDRYAVECYQRLSGIKLPVY